MLISNAFRMSKMSFYEKAYLILYGIPRTLCTLNVINVSFLKWSELKINIRTASNSCKNRYALNIGYHLITRYLARNRILRVCHGESCRCGRSRNDYLAVLFLRARQRSSMNWNVYLPIMGD